MSMFKTNSSNRPTVTLSVSSLLFILLLLITITATLTTLFSTASLNSALISTKWRRSFIPLARPDTVGNRCLYPASLQPGAQPCRPFLGHVRKRFRAGALPRAKQVAISDAYRFVYLKLPKTAGTTVHYGYFHTVMCPIRQGDTKVRHYFEKARAAPIRANCSDHVLFPSLDRGGMPPSITAVPGEKLQHYFVFTIVRNPWERAVSAYEYCYLNRVGSFRQFARNARTFGGSCTKNKTMLSKLTYPNYHWHPLAPELCDSTGTNCFVDYVVDMDRLDPMMDEVVRIINEGRDKSYPPLPLFSDFKMDLNRNTNASKYARYYKDCPECVDWIREFYEEDVTMFGYQFPFRV